MLRHGLSLSTVRERRIVYEQSCDRPTGAGEALQSFKNALGYFGPKVISRRPALPSAGLFACAPGERTFSRVKVPKSPGSGKTNAGVLRRCFDL